MEDHAGRQFTLQFGNPGRRQLRTVLNAKVFQRLEMLQAEDTAVCQLFTTAESDFLEMFQGGKGCQTSIGHSPAVVEVQLRQLYMMLQFAEALIVNQRTIGKIQTRQRRCVMKGLQRFARDLGAVPQVHITERLHTCQMGDSLVGEVIVVRHIQINDSCVFLQCLEAAVGQCADRSKIQVFQVRQALKRLYPTVGENQTLKQVQLGSVMIFLSS